jgi:hypothetical protein
MFGIPWVQQQHHEQSFFIMPLDIHNIRTKASDFGIRKGSYIRISPVACGPYYCLKVQTCCVDRWYVVVQTLP